MVNTEGRYVRCFCACLCIRNTEEMFNLSDESCSSNPATIRRKIAISIIISLPEKEEENHNFQEFFFSHFPLFESHMNKLKTAIERVSVKVQESDSPVLTKQIDSTMYCSFSELKCKGFFFLSENYILPTYSVYMGGSEQTVLYSYNAESRVNICLYFFYSFFFLDMSWPGFLNGLISGFRLCFPNDMLSTVLHILYIN